MYNYFYKIKDTEDDKYSEYLATDRECKTFIENGIDYHYDYPDRYDKGGNVFECIEWYLDKQGIKYAWLNFDIVEY